MTWTPPDQEALRRPEFLDWDIWPFEGEQRIKQLAPRTLPEPPRHGEPGGGPCEPCAASDEAYLWADDAWRLKAVGPSGLPVVLVLEPRAHLDLGDVSDEEAAELGRLTVRIERAVVSLGDIARVHVMRLGDGGAHLHVWFLGRPAGMLQLRGSAATLWDDILPPVPEPAWRADLARVAAAMAQRGGHALAR